MRMEKNPLLVIESMYGGFHRGEKKIADCILSNSSFIIKNNLKMISSHVNVSESSIIRFCQLLGYRGFSDFKVALAHHSKKLDDEIFQIESLDSAEAITKATLLNNMNALKNTLDFINYDELEKAAKLIAQSKKVFIAGSGNSGFIAKMFYSRILTTGLNLVYATDSYGMKQMQFMLDDEMVIIGISQSGKTAELIELFETALQKSVPTIALTASTNNKLTSLANIHLVTAISNSNYIRNYYATEVVFKSILDSLATYINILLGIESIDQSNTIAQNIFLEAKALMKNI
ncbi:DNA-binding MurR/RpiR family transcriptional regulator [Neobacillus niacini]|uniref:MurR/RpiR family transcriptional regulator n=1 Tax=Neobacillus niacini TaxID=86668 RepID=UPI0027824D07|nr:MurR/RpiR family transcriptional regulator [Neobacillus niacini]MDQ1005245.1 DNA-binding MurR/RpiR family transcriptional regulator [Neobacillus niacini]